MAGKIRSLLFCLFVFCNVFIANYSFLVPSYPQYGQDTIPPYPLVSLPRKIHRKCFQKYEGLYILLSTIHLKFDRIMQSCSTNVLHQLFLTKCSLPVLELQIPKASASKASSCKKSLRYKETKG